MTYFPRNSNVLGGAFTRPNASPSATTMRVPPGLSPNKRYPLIVILHSYGATGTDVATRMDLDDAVFFDDGCFVLAPEGQISVASNPNQFWNYWTLGAQQDFAYLADLVSEALAAFPMINASRVYVIGYSNGAFMAHQLSIWEPALFHAGMSFNGAAGVNDDMSVAAFPTPWYHWQATADGTVNPAGDPLGGLPGVLDGHGGVGSVGYKSAADTAAEHNTRNGGLGALGAPGAAFNLVTTPLGNETTDQDYAGTTPQTAVRLGTGAAATHTITIVPGMAQYLFNWMEANHR